MNSKTPGQSPFLVIGPGHNNPSNRLHTAEVTGSNPVAPTGFRRICKAWVRVWCAIVSDRVTGFAPGTSAAEALPQVSERLAGAFGYELARVLLIMPKRSSLLMPKRDEIARLTALRESMQRHKVAERLVPETGRSRAGEFAKRREVPKLSNATGFRSRRNHRAS